MIFTTVSLNSTLKVISNGIQQAYLTNNINLTDFGGVPNGRGGGDVAQMGSNGRIVSVYDIKTYFIEFYANLVI